MVDGYLTSLCGMSYVCVAYAVFFENVFYRLLVVAANLNDDTRVLGKEYGDDVGTLECRQVDRHTATSVCKTHLKECCYKSAGRDVVTSHDESFADKLLDGVEGCAEIFRVLNRRHVVTDKAQALCEGRTAETLLVEGEVDVVKTAVAVVNHYRRYHLANVAYLAAAAYDDRSWRYNLVAIRILL